MAVVSLELAELALNAVQLIAMVHGHTRCQFNTIVLLRVIGHDHQLGYAFGCQAIHDLDHGVTFGPLAYALAAGHGDCIVVQHLVGDVDARGDTHTHRQQSTVEIGTVAQVRKNMCVRRERLLADPGHALATHLGEGAGAAVHPDRHVVAANTGHRPRTFGHAGAGVMRAAAAEPGGHARRFHL